MRHFIRNFLATTGLSLFLLAVVAILFGARFLCVETVLQTGAANLLIHMGLSYLNRFESSFFLVEIGVEIGYILIVLILFGWVFHWYLSTPLWVLILMGILVYAIGSFIDIFQIRNDISFINQKLELRRKQEKSKEASFISTKNYKGIE